MEDELVLRDRNRGWTGNPQIPSWVDPRKVGLDQFFTRPAVAAACCKSLWRWMERDGAVVENYKFIEPSAGTGAFYDLLPSRRRIGLDLVPFRPDYIQTDFLAWPFPENRRRIAVVGNPPFGYRAWLALAFVNRVAAFADYVGMILPMAFQSDGKGSPKRRVEGLKLVHMENLPQDSFVDREGKAVQVNALWQVWQRGVNNPARIPTCERWIDLFTVDNRKERLCGQGRMGEADYFLQRTFFKEPPRLVRDFSQVRYGCGYGIVIKKNKRKVASILRNTDWREYSNLAAHNCRHISMYHIRKAVADAGLR